MQLSKNYKYILGMIAFAAFLYMLVLNVQNIFGVANSLYRAILPLIIGCLIAFILDIIVHRYELLFPKTKLCWMEKIKRPFCTVAGLISVAFMIGFVLYMAIPQTIHSISLALKNLPEVYNQWIIWGQTVTNQYPIINEVLLGKSTANQTNINQLAGYASKWMGGIVNTFGNILYFLINLLIGFVFSVYLLLNKKQLLKEAKEFGEAYLSAKVMEQTIYVLKVFNKTFSNFFVGQFLDALILGTLVGIGLMVFDIPYALNIACVIGLTALVPLVGAYVGASIGIIMLLVESPVHALAFLIILITMQQLENNFIYPKVVGNSIGLPGIWVFASIILGGNLFGVVGMLLSVPVVASLYKIMRSDVKKRLDIKSERKNKGTKTTNVV